MNARLLLLCTALVGAGSAQVSSNRILNANKEPQNWLTYGGSYSSQRYSTLDQINRENVKNLELKWAFQAKWLDPFETTIHHSGERCGCARRAHGPDVLDLSVHSR